tara:strand:+ start:1007 stop:1387 length:381 start_codon:yes stop_codon:yes gene_type:complete
MPSITMNFTAPLNVSCQVGDTAYYVDTGSDGGFTTNGTNSVVKIGQIRQISSGQSNSPVVICDTTAFGELDGLTKFILFSKDNKANLSTLLGYYADVKFVNTSKTESELFAVNIETSDSSGYGSVE